LLPSPLSRKETEAMFQCGICHEQSKDGDKAEHVVLLVRDCSHPGREYKYRKEFRKDRGGSGTQIVSEVLACKPCALKAGAPRIVFAPPPAVRVVAPAATPEPAS